MQASEIAELFSVFGPVRLKRMFGGHGIYAGDLMFAIEAFGEIWVKCDAVSVPQFIAEGLAAFTYEKNGKPYAMSYRQFPAAAYDDPEIAAQYGRRGLDAALRAAAARTSRNR
jgi:DNA transformation protein and related proteins